MQVEVDPSRAPCSFGFLPCFLLVRFMPFLMHMCLAHSGEFRLGPPSLDSFPSFRLVSLQLDICMCSICLLSYIENSTESAPALGPLFLLFFLFLSLWLCVCVIYACT